MRYLPLIVCIVCIYYTSVLIMDLTEEDRVGAHENTIKIEVYYTEKYYNICTF